MIRAENGELRALVIEIESALSDLPRIETESETADSDHRGKPDDGLFSLRQNVGDFIFESRSAEFSHTTGSRERSASGEYDRMIMQSMISSESSVRIWSRAPSKTKSLRPLTAGAFCVRRIVWSGLVRSRF